MVLKVPNPVCAICCVGVRGSGDDKLESVSPFLWSEDAAGIGSEELVWAACYVGRSGFFQSGGRELCPWRRRKFDKLLATKQDIPSIRTFAVGGWVAGSGRCDESNISQEPVRSDWNSCPHVLVPSPPPETNAVTQHRHPAVQQIQKDIQMIDLCYTCEIIW